VTDDFSGREADRLFAFDAGADDVGASSPDSALEPDRPAPPEGAALLEGLGPPPAVWGAIEAELRREGVIEG